MKTFTFTQRPLYGQLSFAGILLMTGLVSVMFILPVSAYTPISSQLDFGERNVDVTNLQDFFADNPAIYPEGLVSGYFGSLTRASVIRFQSQYGIAQAGRVGPVTRDKINGLIASGGWSIVDATGPRFYNVNQARSSNYVTFTFNTNENTTARVAYYTSPLMFNEGDINSNGFGPIGGNSSASNGLSTSHSITLSNLTPNTVYYYTIIVTDAKGNVSVWGPNNSLRTN